MGISRETRHTGVNMSISSHICEWWKSVSGINAWQMFLDCRKLFESFPSWSRHLPVICIRRHLKDWTTNVFATLSDVSPLLNSKSELSIVEHRREVCFELNRNIFQKLLSECRLAFVSRENHHRPVSCFASPKFARAQNWYSSFRPKINESCSMPFRSYLQLVMMISNIYPFFRYISYS
jgi:hypothetical protein